MIYISNSLTLTRPAREEPNRPVLCWKNYVEPGNIATDAAEFSFLDNIANPSTALYATFDTLDEFCVTVDTGGREIDYIGLARHNMDESAEIRVSITFGGSDFFLTDWIPVSDKQVFLTLFSVASPDGIKVCIRGQVRPVTIGVLYAGLATKLQRNLYVGHTPINLGRKTNRIGGLSDSGQYLGEVVTRRTLRTKISLQNLTPLWYRDVLDEYFRQMNRAPAFWAWRPQTYPNEVAYVWVLGDPQPSNQLSNGMMQVDFDVEGIA
jgi:hypothetical protein